jgi:glycosyltransferase involved in cell wall biosynthesis
MTFPLKHEARMPLHVSIGKPITAPGVVATSDGDSKSANPLVSVVIPCYKQAQYLGRAIESVLNQSYRQFEIVVVDDGSPDNTRKIALRYPSVKYIHQRNKGNAAALNTGWRASTGECTVFLDADDVLFTNALQAGVDALRDNPDVALTSGLCRVSNAETGKGYKHSAQTLRPIV